MHVLVIPSWYPTSEAPLNGIYFAEQAQCLSNHGFNVGVIYPEQQSLRLISWNALRRKHFQTEWTSRFGFPTLRRYGWNVWWKLPPGIRCRVQQGVRLGRRYVQRFGVPDIVHAQSGRWAGAVAARLSASHGIPYVLTEHFSGIQRERIPRWRWPIVREGYRHARGIAAVSSSLKRDLVRNDLAAAPSIEILPNLVPGTFFSVCGSGRPTPPPFRYVTIARLTPQKNVRRLLKAFAKVLSAKLDVQLIIVGDGPERSALEKMARRLEISSRVTFRGRLGRRSTQKVLWNAHAFVLPSSYETFGVVLLEAMATGLPVIATASGGPKDIVSEKSGILLPGGTPKDLASGLKTVHDSWSTFDASAIRSYTRQRYGPEPFVRRTRSFYERARADTI